MSVPPGARIGPYEVLASIGAGGMGEVYRARDTRLGRDVAIKVLPRAFTADPDRLARFEREARVLASLNHPNIATIHGIEDSGGIRALVMELVEGETVAERIANSAIPVAAALPLARQIADALDAAHEKGIVHRDLKPANIKITRDGAVKVLDFGLAKANPASGLGLQASGAATMTIGDTREGIIVGTAAYMSPEQARGEAVDSRTDIWAFGCVLYEMLVGRQAFSGKTVSDIIAAVIDREPDWTSLPAATPASVHRLLRRCLAKNPRDRLRHIGDARFELDDPAPGLQPTDGRRGRSSWPALGLAAMIAALAAAAAVWTFLPRQPRDVATISRFALATPESLAPSPRATRDVVISRDGSRIVYATPSGLAVRFIDQLTVRPVEGSETSIALTNPFLSPEGDWIAYTEGSTIRKIPATGGTPITVAEVAPGSTGTWDSTGILFTTINGLYRVSPDGGPVQQLKMDELAPAEQAVYPEALPGNGAVLVTVIPGRTHAVALDSATANRARIDIVNLETGERRTVLRGGGAARYSRTGHLLYGADGTLHAVPFDLSRSEVVGPPVEVVSTAGSSEFDVASNGTLAYIAGGANGDAELVWVDRQGRDRPLEAPARRYMYPRLSPDRTRVAMNIAGSDRDVWVWDMRSKSLERLTQDPADDATLTWAPTGQEIVFGSARSRGIPNIFAQAADGSGAAQRMLESNRTQQPITFAPDGRLIFSEDVPGRGRDILAIRLDGARPIQSLLHSTATEATAEVSPDGRWLAYDSNESGRLEVYVRPYPNTDERRWQVSTGGGKQPRWSDSGKELFYRDLTTAMVAVSVEATPGFAIGARTTLFSRADLGGTGAQIGAHTYDVAPNDQFLMIKRSETLGLIVTQNWFDELKRLAPRR